MKKTFLIFALACPLWASAADGGVDPAALRELLREAGAVSLDSAKARADFEARKAALEGRISLLKALREKLSADLENARSSLAKARSESADAAAALLSYAEFEAALGAAMAEAGYPCPGPDVFAGARDFMDFLKKSVADCGTISLVKDASGRRFARIGIAGSVAEDSSPGAAQLCDMLEGKAPYGVVRLRIKGRGAQ